MHSTEAFRKLARVKPETRAKRFVYKVMLNPSLQPPQAGQEEGAGFPLRVHTFKGQQVRKHNVECTSLLVTQIKLKAPGQIVQFEGTY